MISIGVSLLFLLICLSCFLDTTTTTSGFSMPSPLSSSETKNHNGNGVFAKAPAAVIFDIDGTLVDSWKLGFEATQVVLKHHDLPTIDAATYHECTKFSTPQRLARHAGLEPNTAAFERTGEELAAEFDELYVGLVTTATAGLFPGILGVLQSLASCPSVAVGCLTNACVAYAHAVLEVTDEEHDDLNVTAMCRSVHGADTVPAAKPEPDGLYQVCDELGVPPCQAVYVGDSPSDGLAARAAGMPSIGVTWGSHSEESLRKAPFDYYASTPGELCRILNLPGPERKSRPRNS